MRKFNSPKTRRWAGFPLLICLAAAGLGGCDWTKPKTTAEYLSEAQALRGQGNLKGAIIELRNALQQNPDDGITRALLGRVEAEAGDGATAEKDLRRAMALQVPKGGLLKPLAEALRIQDKHQALLTEIMPAEALLASDRTRLLAWRGDAWLALGKPDKAKAEYQQALALDGNAPLAKLGLARLALLENQPDAAKRLVAEALAVDGKEPALWHFQAGLWERAGELARAEADYTQAMNLRRLNQGDRIGRALARIALGKYAEASQDIEVLKREAPNSHFTHYAEGLLALRLGKFAEAQTALERSERLNDKHPLTYYQLGLAHLSQNHSAQAEQSLTRFLQAVPGSLAGTELMALAKFQKRDFEGVKHLLAPVLQSRPEDVPALKLMGQAEIGLNHIPGGIEYLQKAVALDPNSAATRQGLGLSLLAQGEKAQGLAELEAAAALEQNSAQPDAWIALVHIQAGEPDQALAAINNIRAKSPDSELADHLLGRLSLAKNDLPTAKEAFGRALKKKPGDPAISHQLAQLALREGKPDEARQWYDGALRANPQNLPLQMELGKLDALEGQFKTMAERMDTAIRDNPDVLRPRLIRAEYALRLSQPDRAQALLEQAPSQYSRHPELLALLVQARLDNGQASRALDAARLLTEATPQSAMAHYLLAVAQGDNGNSKDMRKSLDRAVALDPAFGPARRAEVKLLAMEKKYPEAEARLNKLVEERPDDPEVLSLKGWYASLRGQHQDAAQAYRKLLETAPGTRVATRLAQAQWQAGDRAGAVASLETWLDGHPDDGLGRYVLAGLYRETGKREAARQQLEKLLESSPRNVPAMNDLAWLLRDSDPARAVELAERAAEAAPQLPMVLDTLAAILMDRGQDLRAADLLKRAVALDPGNPSISYRLAVALNKAGRTGDSLKTVKSLLSDDRPFPERKDAQALFNRVATQAGE
ncbi:XrtA/PEP-CTERM system TPR-repeat protein PrsT [Methylomagnum sp.]